MQMYGTSTVMYVGLETERERESLAGLPGSFAYICILQYVNEAYEVVQYVYLVVCCACFSVMYCNVFKSHVGSCYTELQSFRSIGAARQCVGWFIGWLVGWFVGW